MSTIVPLQVRRSRQLSKSKRVMNERLCAEREQENTRLEDTVKQLRKEVAFLTKVLRTPGNLSESEKSLLATFLIDTDKLGEIYEATRA
jgi:hypothetical protein